MKTNDYSWEQIQQINPLLFNMNLNKAHKPDILFRDFERMATQKFSKGELENVVIDMINHFKNGNGRNYSNEVLTRHVKEHSTTKAYMELFKNAMIDELIKNNGDINSIKFNDSTKENNALYKFIQKNAKYPVFNSKEDRKTGLTIAINDTWGNNVEVRDYSLDGKSFKGTLHFRFYDHFGLDQPDVEKKYVLLSGFRSGFVLQHYKGFEGKYKPFKTIIEIDVPFEGELE